MSNIIKFEFITGRGVCIQVLFKNHIYNKLCDGKYKCMQMKCSSVIGVNESLLTVLKEPTAHNVHEELTKFRIAVLQATTMMKEQAKNDTSASIREIYDNSLKSLTDANITSLADITDPLLVNLSPPINGFGPFRFL